MGDTNTVFLLQAAQPVVLVERNRLATGLPAVSKQLLPVLAGFVGLPQASFGHHPAQAVIEKEKRYPGPLRASRLPNARRRRSVTTAAGLRPPLASWMLPIATPRRAEGGLQVLQHQFGFRFIVEILHLPPRSLGKAAVDANRLSAHTCQVGDSSRCTYCFIGLGPDGEYQLHMIGGFQRRGRHSCASTSVQPTCSPTVANTSHFAAGVLMGRGGAAR